MSIILVIQCDPINRHHANILLSSQIWDISVFPKQPFKTENEFGLIRNADPGNKLFLWRSDPESVLPRQVCLSHHQIVICREFICILIWIISWFVDIIQSIYKKCEDDQCCLGFLRGSWCNLITDFHTLLISISIYRSFHPLTKVGHFGSVEQCLC